MIVPEFKTKKEMFEYLKSNKKELLSIKKASFKSFVTSDGLTYSPKLFASKADNDTSESITKHIVGNTYYWMDNHDDMHVKGIFTKSIQETKKIFHYHDHVNQLTAQVGKMQEVNETVVKWRDLGADKDGETISLIGKTKVLKSFNEMIFDMYKDGEIDQHSVGMIYVNLSMAINDPEQKEEFETFEKYYPLMGNPERADKRGFFFVIHEAKLIEISAVTRGSNELTGTLPEKTKGIDELTDLVSPEVFIALQSALEKNEAVDLTLHEVKPQETKSIIQLMAEA